MNLRRMSHQDINSILDLDREITKGRSIITREDLVTMNPGGALDCSFVYESEGKLVGFILAQISYLGLLSGETCLIHGVGVDPAYQQHGIGSNTRDATFVLRKVLGRCRGILMQRAIAEPAALGD